MTSIEGIACFKAVTERATYFCDKAGAGFRLDGPGVAFTLA